VLADQYGLPLVTSSHKGSSLGLQLIFSFCSVCGWLWGHSKAEFVIYKLREMGKLNDKDIADVIQEFTELDIHNTGKITRAYLQEGN
jgi:hypothetical protein